MGANNRASHREKNLMRPIPLGCMNCIHVDSALAGSKATAILSVIENCRRMYQFQHCSVTGSADTTTTEDPV
jgi:hypothetical protein